MKSKNQFLRYKLIDQVLRERTWVKTTQLSDRIEAFTLEKVSTRTIQKDINAMRDSPSLGYNAPIEYSNQRKAYRYTDSEYSISKFSLKENEISALKFYTSCLNIYGAYGIFKDFTSAIQKILDGISIKNKYGAKIDDIIIQTDTVISFHGSEHLETIVQAIDERIEIEFDYVKFGDIEKKKRLLNPYLLKEYRNRWYIIGYLEGKNKVITFGLDRISNLRLTYQTFERDKDFDHDKYFNHSFGITRPEHPAETIILEFKANQAPYIKSLPIHSSQVILKETTKFLRVSINVIPCYELYEYILSKTPDVKILAPISVRDDIKRLLHTGTKQYL